MVGVVNGYHKNMTQIIKDIFCDNLFNLRFSLSRRKNRVVHHE